MSQTEVSNIPNSFASFLVSQPCWKSSPFAQYDALNPYERVLTDDQHRKDRWSQFHCKAAKEASHALVKLSPRVYGVVRRSSVNRARLSRAGLQDFEVFSLQSKGSYSDMALLLSSCLPLGEDADS